jgi:hypothetical protein
MSKAIHIHVHDAAFVEGDHPRGEGGQFTAGAGGSKPHRRDAPVKRLMEDPHGWSFMEDEDGNNWFWSHKSNAWKPRPGNKAIGGEGWYDYSKALSRPKATAQNDPVGVDRHKQAQARAKRIIPRAKR